MEKFISLPVTNEPNQLVSANGIKLIDQASTTTVTITYGGAAAQDVITITHTALAAGDESMQAFIQDSVIEALQTAWQKPSYAVIIPSDIVAAAGGAVTITGIAIA